MTYRGRQPTRGGRSVPEEQRRLYQLQFIHDRCPVVRHKPVHSGVHHVATKPRYHMRAHCANEVHRRLIRRDRRVRRAEGGAFAPRLVVTPLRMEKKMPKMKTKSGAKKRFKVTAGGRVKVAQAGKRHGMIKRTRKFIRQARGTTVLSKPDERIVKKYLPYDL